MAINPQGSVPALIHDGIAIYGSENIMRYIEARFTNNSLVPYPELEKDTWDWVEAATRTHIFSIVGHLFAKEFGRPARKDKLHFYKKYNQDKYQFLIDKGYHMSNEQKEEALTIVKLQMQRLEMALQNHTYILGNKISMADIAWAANIVFLEFLDFDFSNYPKIQKWMEKMKKRPSFNEKSEMPKYTSRFVKFYFKVLLMTKSYLKYHAKNI